MKSKNASAAEAFRDIESYCANSPANSPNTEAPTKPIFVIRLQATRPTSSGSAIRGLRWILKGLGRAHGFRCIDISMDRGRR